MSAEPSLEHQRVSGRLLRLLQDGAPPDLEVFLPVDVRLSPVRQEPDDGVVTVLELAGGACREVARGDDVTVERPFPVRIRLRR